MGTIVRSALTAQFGRRLMLVLVVIFGSRPVHAQSGRLEGTVRDATGAVIPRATVQVTGDALSLTAETDSAGQFVFSSLAATHGTIRVGADGFSNAQAAWRLEAGQASLDIILQPLSASEQVTVSAARTEVRLSATPGSTVLLTAPDLKATPALRVDDVLRQVPGFSLFRRSSSRVANASNQGVSLRGLGGTAASRALVLEDGIPLVDTFGGWVYWDRIPPAALSSVEVFRGGVSNLYGSDALGGVVQFRTLQPTGPALRLETSYSNERTPDLNFWTGTTTGPWDFSLASDLYRSDGFVLVPLALRGTIDTPANLKDATLEVNVGRHIAGGRIFGRGSFLDEFRNNGTPIQTNDTQLGEGALGWDQQLGKESSLSLRAYGLVQGYDQAFSSIASNRDSESLTDLQHVPEQVGGGGVQWNHLLGKHQTLIAGMDGMEVMGASDDRLFSSGTATRTNTSGGRQRIFGFFAEDMVRLRDRWTIILGGRFDDWSNFNATSICTPVAGSCSTSPSVLFPSRSDQAFDPRLSVLRTISRNVSLTASMYRAFRAPTLNELYRTFRMGSILTLNNPSLIAERLTGAEAGANISAWERKLDLRGTFFWSDIVDPVQNVTLSQTAALITREKENLGRTRSRGAELDGVVHVTPEIQFSAGYEFTAARVVSFPSPPSVSLVGLEVAQVPRNGFTWQARYWNPRRIFLSVQGRFVGKQFDDDQNQLPLDRFYTMDVQVGRAMTRQLELFAAAENLLDKRYQVARTPIVNLGPPILYRAGLRLTLGKG